MLPYISIIFLLLAFSVFDKTKFENIAFIFFSFALVIFSGFRVGGTGPGDYDAYIRLYYQVSDWYAVVDPKIHAEIGFRLMSYLGNLMNFEGHFIILTMALLSSVPIIIIVKNYSCYPILSLIVWIPYFLTMNMHSSRIAVAAAFCLCFFISTYYRRFIFSVFFSVVAIAFHTSSLVIILLFLVRFKIKTLFFLFMISFVVGGLFSPFSILTHILSIIGLERASWFVESYKSSSDYGYPMAVYDPRILLNIGVSLLIFNIRKSVSNPFHEYIFKLTFIGTIIMLLFSSVTIMAWRVSYLFLLSTVISIPILCQYYNYRLFYFLNAKRIASIIFGVVFLIYALPIVFTSLPYQFYF
ncbi:EpsG family protein [Vibrio metschnikovii]|nr:EpsG family protein [Vibrio metschnikovii]EKO3625613.1 EpsG family protein [Vibrio metschnikovii]EKO3705499.1 EpsG family protein [Vibrio metschnikovii]